MIDALLSHPYLGHHTKFHYSRYYIIFTTNADDVVHFWRKPQNYEIKKVTIIPELRTLIAPTKVGTSSPKEIRAEPPFIPKEIRSELIDYLENEWKYAGHVDFKEPQLN